MNTVFIDNIQVYFRVFICERSMVLQAKQQLQEHLAMNGIYILLKHEIRLEIVLLIKFKNTVECIICSLDSVVGRVTETTGNVHVRVGQGGTIGVLPTGV